MYNKEFKITVTAVTPYSANEGEANVTGITITGNVITAGEEFLSDIHVGGKVKRAGLSSILAGSLPIEGSVPLKFTERDDEMLTFPGIKERIPCKIVHIEPSKADLDGNSEIKIKVKIPHVKPKVAGEIVNSLRQEILIQVDSSQKELFE